jgi:hypothetical protein
MIGIIRTRRAAAADWNAKAAAAQIGETWTVRYVTPRAIGGGRYWSWAVGPVTCFADSHPVPARRGAKNLGETNLDQPLSWFAYPATRYLLTPGDAAPHVRHGGEAELRAVPRGAEVTVEHLTGGGIREVEMGRAGNVIDFHDGQGPGRDVGNAWVAFADVTGVQR